MSNQSFTWSNMQETPTLARLDRFLLSTKWDQDFPFSKVVALPEPRQITVHFAHCGKKHQGEEEYFQGQDETVDHLFTQCVFLRYIMVMGLEDVHADELGDDVLVVWDKWMGKAAGRGSSNGLSELIACWWTIWKARNNLIFRQQQLDPFLAVRRSRS
uniref:Reverse transcriptase zinc-binding domain-containing protein n=1 Tax=Ananas comosus var. bracteatus TaxID=296719 RepID=A0A6V7P4Z5_ANACO|nr:unnamed protein product [Ananas comosus var. bracteatus]